MKAQILELLNYNNEKVDESIFSKMNHKYAKYDCYMVMLILLKFFTIQMTIKKYFIWINLNMLH